MDKFSDYCKVHVYHSIRPVSNSSIGFRVLAYFNNMSDKISKAKKSDNLTYYERLKYYCHYRNTQIISAHNIFIEKFCDYIYEIVKAY